MEWQKAGMKVSYYGSGCGKGSYDNLQGEGKGDVGEAYELRGRES